MFFWKKKSAPKSPTVNENAQSELAAENPTKDVAVSAAPLVPAPEPIETQDIADILQIVESRECGRFMGETFQRKFGGAPPDIPRHFIAFYSIDGVSWQPIGYVHFWQRESAFMCGGLVIEDRAFRRMPKPHRALIKATGGVAELMLGTAIAMLPDNDVVWGYVGDTRAERVDMRVGFEHTHIEKIIAYWNKSYTAEEKIQLAEEIAQVGPF